MTLDEIKEELQTMILALENSNKNNPKAVFSSIKDMIYGLWKAVKDDDNGDRWEQ